jgi:integrase
VASAMFNHAIVLKWIVVNPINKAVKRHREGNRERYLTPDEFARLNAALDHCGSRVAADLIRLLAHTGARKGEAMAAKWSEFDLADPVRASWCKPSHHTKQKRTHDVPLTEQAVAVLLEMKARAREGAIYVFGGADGKPITSIKTAWRSLMRRSQIEGFRIHDLRHTFASRLVSEGASLSQVGQLLGHTQPATTFRYAHLSKDSLRATLALLASPRPEPVVAMLE